MYSDKNVIGAQITAVEPDSPAAAAGISLGMTVMNVDGVLLRDYIDWLWVTDGLAIELKMSDGQTFKLQRNAGEAWGIGFAGVLFDGLRSCVNNCNFCFEKMLPSGMRPALYGRDDDYRLSFLQGNFVTLTNFSDADVERVIEMHLSPLNVSLHAVSSDYRTWLMGKNQGRGMAVLEQLLDADILIHAQVVLVPHSQALAELQKTLEWAEQRPGIVSLGVVPYGYTKYAAKLDSDFGATDTTTSTATTRASACEIAKSVIKIIEPFQERSCLQTGHTRFMLADEFYLNAYGVAVAEHLPAANHYDNYVQYQNGIGMLRSWLDEAWEPKAPKPSPCFPPSSPPQSRPRIYCGAHCEHNRPRNKCGDGNWQHQSRPLVPEKLLVTGEAFAPILQKSLNGQHQVLAIKNNFFGGNVNVAGLLTAQDVIEQVQEYRQSQPQQSHQQQQHHQQQQQPPQPPQQQTRPAPQIILPGVMFNDDGLTLDDKTAIDIADALNCEVVVVDC